MSTMEQPREAQVVIGPALIRIVGRGELQRAQRGCLMPSVARQITRLITADNARRTETGGKPSG